MATAATLAGDSASAFFTVGALGTLTFLLAAPLVHVFHGRPGLALASLGLRVILPILGGWAGASAMPHCGGADFCIPSGLPVGLLLGVVGAAALDASAFAYEDAPASSTRAAPPPFALRPELRVMPGGAWFGLGARF